MSVTADRVDGTEAPAISTPCVEANRDVTWEVMSGHINDLIVLADLSGTIFYVSPSCRALGYEQGELIGCSAVDFIHPEDVEHANANLTALFAGEDGREPGDREHRFRRKDGSWVWLQGNPSVLEGAPGEPIGMINVFRDVTERHAAELAQEDLKVRLEAAVAQAEKAAAVKSEFLANMSHEIRTPLTVVLGFTGLLAERDDLSAEARGQVERIAGAGRALLALVNDVLDFSKLEAGQVTITPTPTDAAGAGREVLEMFEAQAEAKGLELRFEARSDTPERVWVDGGRLRQILVNLIGNAVKFTERGTVAVRVEYDLEAQRMAVEVADTGPGIGASARDKLFERFSQVDGSSTRVNGGTGLGLAICRRLAEAMGGAVSLRSRVGYGSTFRVELPARPAEAAPQGETAALDLTELVGIRVLVADDNAANRELARAVLEPAGVEVSEAQDGAEAVRMADALPVDLILMDLRMPGLGGCAAAQAIRLGEGPNRDIPILAFSADYDLSEGRRGTLPLFNGQVRKPVSSAELIEAVRAAVSEAPEAAQEALYVRA